MSELGRGREFDLIRAFLAHAATRPQPLVEVGPGDDCAVVGGYAITSDMSVENVHFRREWLAPAEIGYRATVAALSDLAAVAATPVAALVSFGFPAIDADGWATIVMRGVNTALTEYATVLVGGDVTRSDGAAVLDVTAIGRAERPVLRSTARIGDEVWVTGTLGGAAAAVAAWLSGRVPAATARERYARPVARIAEAAWLQDRVHAMIDLSDGIAGDAGHLAAASQCCVRVDAERLPVHVAADVRLALQGGEDYELCVTAAAGTLAAARDEFEDRFGIPLTCVGDVVTGEGVAVENAVVDHGFDHFALPRQP